MNQLSYYTIRSKHSGRVLDISQEGDNISKLIIWKQNGDANQQFAVTQLKSGEQMIICKKSGLALTVQSDQDGGTIGQSSFNEKANQHFKVVPITQGGNQFFIYTFTGSALDCEGGSKHKNTRVIQWKHHGQANQVWIFEQVKPIVKNYCIACAKTSKALDLCKQGENAGSLIIWEGNGADQQIFGVEKAGSHVRLISRRTGLYLTVEDNSTEKGAKIVEKEFSNQPGQTFSIRPVEDYTGDFFIYTFCGKVLDVCGQKSNQDGSLVVQYDINWKDNQMWRFLKVKD